VDDKCQRTGTMTENGLSDSFYGSCGIGRARIGMTGISWSNANDLECAQCSSTRDCPHERAIGEY
jgi:hypothetical protein